MYDRETESLWLQVKRQAVTGPLTGTMAATGGRYSVITKSPLTGAIASSEAGGWWGHEFKRAGFDAYVLRGRAPTLSRVIVDEDRVRLVEAAELAGRTLGDSNFRSKTGLSIVAIERDDRDLGGVDQEATVRIAGVHDPVRRELGDEQRRLRPEVGLHRPVQVAHRQQDDTARDGQPDQDTEKIIEHRRQCPCPSGTISASRGTS